MTARELERLLKKDDHRTVVIYSQSRASGLYIRHNDRSFDEGTGFKFVCGIPSPRASGNIRKYNWLDEEGRWNRGLKEIARKLSKFRLKGRRVFQRGTLERIAPGFGLGSCGVVPRDALHVQEDVRKRQKRKELMGGGISRASQLMEAM